MVTDNHVQSAIAVQVGQRCAGDPVFGAVSERSPVKRVACIFTVCAVAIGNEQEVTVRRELVNLTGNEYVRPAITGRVTNNEAETVDIRR